MTNESIETIKKAWEKMVESEERQAPIQPHPYIYASGWRECLRRMYLEATRADELPPFDTETLAKMRRGRDRERDLCGIQLVRAGQYSEPPFTVEQQQQHVVLMDRKGRKAITGRVDGFINMNGSRIPFEVKSWNYSLTERMLTFKDVLEGKWTRSGAFQILAYMYATNSPVGVLILDRPGLPRLIPVSLMDHLSEMEQFLERAETVLDHIESGIAPDYHPDASVCRECPLMGKLCFPPMSYEGGEIITDEEVISLLERREALKEAAAEYEHLDKAVKERFRGVELAVAGPFLIQGKYSASTTYDIPPEVKAQYKRTDPKGRFILTVTRMK